MQVGEGTTCTPRLLPLAGVRPNTVVSGLCTHSRRHTAMPRSSGHSAPAGLGCHKQCRRGLQHMRPFLPALELGGPAGRSVGRTLFWLAGGPPLPPPHPHMVQRGLWWLTGPISEHQHVGGVRLPHVNLGTQTFSPEHR